MLMREHLFCDMGNTYAQIDEKKANSQEINMLIFLELGDLHCQKGDSDSAIDYYLKGLDVAKSLNDRSRVQQFSNLILTYI